MNKKVATSVIGKRKTCTAIAKFTDGNGQVRLNGVPIDLIKPEILKAKVLEPIKIAGEENMKGVNINLSTTGGGTVAKVYAIRQAIAKAIIAHTTDEAIKTNLRKAFIVYDRHLLVADTRRAEAKKFGGRGARARRQKSYR